jgi:apolipoprotein N-acyltransferase
MRLIAIVLLQVVIAVLVAGLVMPALLFTVPQTRRAGPLTMVLVVSLLFGLLRLAWPSSRGKTHSDDSRQ